MIFIYMAITDYLYGLTQYTDGSSITNTSCGVGQVLTFKYPISTLDSDPDSYIYNISIYSDPTKTCRYDNSCIKWAYSTDNICYSCWLSYDDFKSLTVDLSGDLYVKALVNGPVYGASFPYIDEDAGTTTDEDIPYSVQLDNDNNFTSNCSSESSSLLNNANLFDPYSGMSGALQLQQYLADTVSCMFGIQCYYFKLEPDANSKDMTFKEYALYGVKAVKMINIMIQDGTMPSSKPEFSEFGLDFATDWEVEIVKNTFMTAFGQNVQPQEGDFIYIPMMKRMWTVQNAYEEKNGNLMWMATSWKVALAKYQDRSGGSVDLGDTEAFVNSLVKTKYEDLFGNTETGAEDAEQTYDSGRTHTSAPKYAANALYPVFESDAQRKFVTCDTVKVRRLEPTVSGYEPLYHRGALVSDYCYVYFGWQKPAEHGEIVYQHQFCGDTLSLSFIISLSDKEQQVNGDMPLASVCGLINIYYNKENKIVYINNIEDGFTIDGFEPGEIYLVSIAWSKSMKIVSMSQTKYTALSNVPKYMINAQHKLFDFNEAVRKSYKYDNDTFDLTDIKNRPGQELDICLYVPTNVIKYVTCFKVYDIYMSDDTMFLQMFPTNQHLCINDTARPIIGMSGFNI